MFAAVQSRGRQRDIVPSDGDDEDIVVAGDVVADERVLGQESTPNARSSSAVASTAAFKHARLGSAPGSFIQ